MTIVKYKRKIKPSSFNIDSLNSILEICMREYTSRYKALEEKWEKEKLPELEKKIKKHNKKIESEEISYFFPTNLPISDASEIIEQEKLYFIHTESGLYSYENKILLKYKGEKELESDDIDVFSKNIYGLGNLTKIEIIFKSSNRKSPFINFPEALDINLNIDTKSLDKSFFQISGTKEETILAIQEKIIEILNDAEYKNYLFFRDDTGRVLVSLFSSFFISTLIKRITYSLFSIQVSFWIFLIPFTVFFILIFRILVKNYKTFDFESKNEKTGSFMILSFIIVTILTAIINEIFVFIKSLL